jgi:uncharacterized protein YggU (UPF0235/DUF167 family)
MQPEESPYSSHPDGTVVEVWVVPGATRDSIEGVYDGALRIRVAAPPERGRATEAVGRLLARRAGVRRARLLSGARSRRKRFLLPGLAPAEAADRLPEPGAAPR